MLDNLICLKKMTNYWKMRFYLSKNSQDLTEKNEKMFTQNIDFDVFNKS